MLLLGLLKCRCFVFGKTLWCRFEEGLPRFFRRKMWMLTQLAADTPVRFTGIHTLWCIPPSPSIPSTFSQLCRQSSIFLFSTYGRNPQPSYAQPTVLQHQQQLPDYQQSSPFYPQSNVNSPIGFLALNVSNPSGRLFSFLHALSFSI